MSYKRLGDYIKRVSIKNSDGLVEILYGINIDKFFMPSVANVIGTDLSRYKVVTKNQFACNRMHVGRDKRLPISLSLENYDFIVSPAYDVFEITDTDIISYEYLMMWFTREEFDRNCWFHTDSDVRGKLDWDAFMDMELPIPSIVKQQQIVAEYNTVTNRINLNNQINQNLEETAQALYKHWFIDFEFPNTENTPYKSSGGEMVYNEELEKDIPVGWSVENLSTMVDSDSTISYGVVQPGSEDINGVKFIRSGDIENGQIQIDKLRTITSSVSQQFKRTILSGGEIIVSIVGKPGQVAIVPYSLDGANIARQVALIKISILHIASYIKNYLNSGFGKGALRDITIGSVQEVINLSD